MKNTKVLIALLLLFAIALCGCTDVKTDDTIPSTDIATDTTSQTGDANVSDSDTDKQTDKVTSSDTLKETGGSSEITSGVETEKLNPAVVPDISKIPDEDKLTYTDVWGTQSTIIRIEYPSERNPNGWYFTRGIAETFKFKDGHLAGNFPLDEIRYVEQLFGEKVRTYLLYSENELSTATVPNNIESITLWEYKNYISVDGVIFSSDMKRIAVFPSGRTGEYVIPDGVEEIEANAFGCTKLTKITVPSSVRNAQEQLGNIEGLTVIYS